MNLRDLRWGYVPVRSDFSPPGDRRRFCRWAALRGVSYEIARPTQRYDVVVLTQMADITRWAQYQASDAKVVFDLVDSYLAIPRTDVKALFRGTAKFLTRQWQYPAFDYWRAVRRMCRRSDAVVCATEEQRSAILQDCRNIHIVLDFQDTDVRAVKTDYSAGAPFSLVWEGLPVNLRTLRSVAPVLGRLRRRYDFSLRVVTDPFYYAHLGRLGRRDSRALASAIIDAPVELYTWSADVLSRIATRSDVAIIPIPMRDALARGKPENKLLLFWRLGVPTVTTATPAYERAMEACGVSLACRTNDEWVTALERCFSDEGFRTRAATAGQAYALREHSESRLLARWDAVFASLFTDRIAA